MTSHEVPSRDSPEAASAQWLTMSMAWYMWAMRGTSSPCSVAIICSEADSFARAWRCCGVR